MLNQYVTSIVLSVLHRIIPFILPPVLQQVIVLSSVVMDGESEAQKTDSILKITKQESGRTEMKSSQWISPGYVLQSFSLNHMTPATFTLSSNTTRILPVLKHYVVWCNSSFHTGLLFLLEREPLEGRGCVLYSFLSSKLSRMPNILGIEIFVLMQSVLL